MMISEILDWFAEEMKKKGFRTFRCGNPICGAVRWLELNEGSTLEDVVTGKGGVTMMRYGHLPENDCENCRIISKAASGLE